MFIDLNCSQVSDVAHGPLVICMCTNNRLSTAGGLVDASVCTAFVAEVTNSTDRVEVRLNPIRTADVIINSHAQDFTDVSWLRYRGMWTGGRSKSKS